MLHPVPTVSSEGRQYIKESICSYQLNILYAPKGAQILNWKESPAISNNELDQQGELQLFEAYHPFERVYRLVFSI